MEEKTFVQSSTLGSCNIRANGHLTYEDDGDGIPGVKYVVGNCRTCLKGSDVEERINTALAKLRDELLDLKKQDSMLYRELSTINSHIQRLKVEISLEEERKALEDDADGDDETDDEDSYYVPKENLLARKNTGMYTDHNSNRDMNRAKLSNNAKENITHERYDSGIQTDENEKEDVVVYVDTHKKLHYKKEKIHESFTPEISNPEGTSGGSSERRKDKSDKTYTTFVLSSPKETNIASDIRARKTPNKTHRDGIILQAPLKRTMSVGERSFREDLLVTSKTIDLESRTRSQESLHHSYDSRPRRNDNTWSTGTAQMQPWEKSHTGQRENNVRGSMRSKGNFSTISLVDISENGELMLHNQKTGKSRSIQARKKETQQEVCSAINVINNRRPKGYNAAYFQGKASSTLDLRTPQNTRRESCSSIRDSRTASSLSDLRKPLDRPNNSTFVPCGFTPVPGQRNTLPLSRTSSVDITGKPFHDGEHKRNVYRDDPLNQNLRRAYSLTSQKRSNPFNPRKSQIEFYRSPAGENFQEHTIAYQAAVRSFSRSISVASLV